MTSAACLQQNWPRGRTHSAAVDTVVTVVTVVARIVAAAAALACVMVTAGGGGGGGGSGGAGIGGATAALVAAAASASNDHPDLAGSYCATRPRGCCVGRQDDCSAPILGTLCYCDEFCNHTRSEDCCPDYWSFCRGIELPKPAPPEIKRELFF